MGGELSSLDWLLTGILLRKMGITNIVLTGGEPLIRPDIVDIATHLFMSNYRVTLSTNAMLLRQRESILQYIHEIGIPIDGPTEEVTSRVRPGPRGALHAAINALELVGNHYPLIETTIRTVLVPQNRDYLPEIAENIVSRYPECRWKIYQPTRIGYAVPNWQSLEVGNKDFDEATSALTREFPNLHVITQHASDQQGNYLLIGPDGEVYGIDSGLNKISAGNLLSTGLENMVYAMAGLIHLPDTKDELMQR